MRIRATACAILACPILACMGSGPTVAGPLHAQGAPAMFFGDVITRPPRSIPNPRPPFSRSAAMMRLPRARPVTAAEPVAAKQLDGRSAPAAVTVQPSSPPGANGSGTAQTFPPVVTFE